MLTRIEIDDQLMAEAMRTTGVTSRSAVVDLALQTLVEMVLAERRSDAQWIAASDPCADQPAESWLDEHEADLTFFAAYLGLPHAG